MSKISVINGEDGVYAAQVFLESEEKIHEQIKWFKDYLRSIGVKSWCNQSLNKKDKTVETGTNDTIGGFCPNFNEGVQKGDLVCVGWWDKYHKEFWVVRVAEYKEKSFMGGSVYYYDKIVKQYPK